MTDAVIENVNTVEAVDVSTVPTQANPIPTIPTPVEDSKSFELNEMHEVSFNVRPGAPKPLIVTHTLRKPTLDELQARENNSPYATRESGKDSEEILLTGGAASAKLYDKLVQTVKGAYVAEKFIDFASLDPAARQEMLTRIPSNHKVQVVQSMYAFFSEIDYGEDELDNFIWGGEQEYTIKTVVGADEENPEYVVRHIMRQPNESELLTYNQDKQRFLIKRGDKRPVSEMVNNLYVSARLYDKLVKRVEGASFNGLPVDVQNVEHLKSIDAVMKRSVVEALVGVTQLELGK